MTAIQLIVGLGNPGAEYEQTRHNAGALFVERIAAAQRVNLVPERKFFGLTGRFTHQGQDVRLLIPTTYMNRSGQAVAALAGFYRIPVESILVAHDELDLPPGVAKLKVGGGHGGHNGLRDIIAQLGNQN
ncbi:aminoacyl-tRNA hydrolase, partial [Pseudomonas syringae]